MPINCALYTRPEVSEIEARLNEDFASICDWFVDNKLTIPFGEDKTKLILLATKNKIRQVGNLNITYIDISLYRHLGVEGD